MLSVHFNSSLFSLQIPRREIGNMRNRGGGRDRGRQAFRSGRWLERKDERKVKRKGGGKGGKRWREGDKRKEQG